MSRFDPDKPKGIPIAQTISYNVHTYIPLHFCVLNNKTKVYSRFLSIVRAPTLNTSQAKLLPSRFVILI